jgi:endonuclease-3
MKELSETRIARLIYPVGFYKQKARNIKRIAQILGNNIKAEIPSTYDKLSTLPGVGRKTANLVIALAFNKPSIAVDTHVFRISQRLGWASGQTPGEIEDQLRRIIPSQHWNRINQLLVGFGQTICKPISPKCKMCEITAYCQFFREQETKKFEESV